MQFVTIENTEIVMPMAEVRQSTVSSIEDGHSAYIKSIPWILSIPDTPDASNSNTTVETMPPTTPAMNRTFRVFTPLPLDGS